MDGVLFVEAWMKSLRKDSLRLVDSFYNLWQNHSYSQNPQPSSDGDHNCSAKGDNRVIPQGELDSDETVDANQR